MGRQAFLTRLALVSGVLLQREKLPNVIVLLN